MAAVPQGARRSEDGYYWWDGADWQEVPDDERVLSATASESPDGPGISHGELAGITSEEQLDERSKPYFQPDPDKYPDDASDAEGADVLSDEPAPGAAGGY